LSGSFAQLLRYTAPADARSTIVRLRSAGTASLAFEQNPALKKMGALMEWSPVACQGSNFSGMTTYWIDLD